MALLRTPAKLHRAIGLVLLAIAGACPASARTVEYLNDMAAIKAAADDQGIPGPFSNPPAPGKSPIILVTPNAADHRVITASNYCQAYHIDNPVSTLLADLLAAANPPAPAGENMGQPAQRTLRLISGSTLLRCMGKSDVATICKNRVSLRAELSFTRPDGASTSVPLVAQIEREGRVGGFCGNIARYTGIVTREAAIDLIRQANAATGE